MYFKLLLLAFFIAINCNKTLGEFLRIEENKFYYGDQQVFLSGVNIAWNDYGLDFGNGNYTNQGPLLEQWIREISAAGGNSLRIWVHVEGKSTPQFDSNGYVVAPDNTGTFINDLARFLDIAAENNVFVIPVLWNGAVMDEPRSINLVWDDDKLNSYINNALRPIVRALKDKPALAAWEVINEPEGSVLIESHANPCFDTTTIGQFGAGWTRVGLPMQRFLRFINLQNAAIRAEDPKVLITASSWSEHSQNSAFTDSYNHYSDECLRDAGGQRDGIIDFYQIHTYSWEGSWSSNTPFKKNAVDYLLDKPVVVGEFSSDCAENEGIDYLWSYIYNNSYSGAWSWQYNEGGNCADTRAQQDQGMTLIKGFTHNGKTSVTISYARISVANTGLIAFLVTSLILYSTEFTFESKI